MKEKKTVIKFGGSNLKSIESLEQIIKVVESYNKPVIVVVSAFYGITDKLVSIVKNNGRDHKQTEVFIEYLHAFKLEVIDKCISNPDLKAEVKNILNFRIGKLRTLIEEMKYKKNKTSDTILSYGELLSSLIITYLLKNNYLEAEEKLPEQIGLISDGRFGNATIELTQSANKVQKSLVEDKIFVIPGFYGISERGEVTLLGRGGTDYSAASIASCINAQSLDVWKDVDGFMSANPKFVNHAKKIETLSYNEAAELAYFGARILHPGTIEPLQAKSIPLQIFNITKQTDAKKPCSVINGKTRMIRDRIKSVTYSEDFAILKLKGSSVGIKPGILAKVATILDEHNINIKSVITSQIAINLLLSKNDLIKAKALTTGLCDSDIKTLKSYSGIALIAAIGEGITRKHGIAAKVFNSIAGVGINVQMIAFGASQVSSYFIVDIEDMKRTIQVIHREFFAVPGEVFTYI